MEAFEQQLLTWSQVVQSLLLPKYLLVLMFKVRLSCTKRGT